MSAGPSGRPPLDPRALLTGARLLVFGGTGFLGKVWLSMLLDRYPELGHVYLVVRPRGGGLSPREGSEARFWGDVATNHAFDPLRLTRPGAEFERFLREKITPIPGDVTRPLAGVPPEIVEELRGGITALVNASGVVDFDPPLDESLNVNAFGMQNLVSLARALGDVPFLHTSTCYVAGDRTGQVDELDPLRYPFPKANTLPIEHWDPEREIAECVDLVEHVRHRANDAFRQTAFLDQARKTLSERGEPTRGSALQDELSKVKRKYEEEQLIAAGTERAKYWGWHNIYTYTKSIGEQILCKSGLRFTIVRPAVVESAEHFPAPGWNEGINTSAPLIYLAIRAPGLFPAEADSVLDVIPVDQVAAGTTLALLELLEGHPQRVYQLGSSDTSALKVERLIELTGLYKRRHYLSKATGNKLINWVHAHLEPVPIDADGFASRGQQFYADRVRDAAGWLGRLATGPVKPLLDPAVRSLEGAARQLGVSARIIQMYVPFMATHSYRFSCAHTREAYARLPEADREALPWHPERIEWRHYLHDVHIPGLERHVWPEIEKKLDRKVTPLRTYDNLLDLLDEVAERHDLAPALLVLQGEDFARVSYRDMRDRAAATAARLRLAGVEIGDRVLLAGHNHPDWVIAWFGIQWAGGVAVPVDPALSEDAARRVAEAAGLSAAVLDAAASHAFGSALVTSCYNIHEITAPLEDGDPEPFAAVYPTPETVASVLFTSGTTGNPKGVMLTHANFASLLASLSKLFDLGEEDRVLSVLPLHHSFEFSCGLLLPLSRGTRILYLDEVNGERLSLGLREGRVTAMVGVPALWQLLERRIRGQVREQGRVFEMAVDAGLELNRVIGAATGMDAGRLFFAPVHQRLGGNIRYLISGGSALPPETHKLFSGLGLHLAEGYGLTEAAPVLTVARGKPGAKAGHVGEAIPGVQIRIADPDDKGVGEVLARGPNVMDGYWANREATRAVVDEEGWLHTGDLGRLDHRGRLVLVGRAKEVVVTASGENIYLEDLENRFGNVPGVSEYAFVGIDDPRGGERLGLLAVPEEGDADRTSRHDRAKKALKTAIEGLPTGQRPAVVHLVDAPLPRTATRKVIRREARAVLERIALASTEHAEHAEGSRGPVAHAIASVAGLADHKLEPGMRMIEDLAFDSLMWVELSSALDATEHGSPGVDALSRAETVADVIRLLGEAAPALKKVEPPPDKVEIPTVLVEPLKTMLAAGQHAFYHRLLDMHVTGTAYIPQNRPTIVVSNHSSHLDMGLVKMALGPYGQRIVALAAKDYFFEGNKYLVAYFEQLTNLQPLDRKSGFRASFEAAKRVVEQGHVVLIFPEGTRSTDGSLQPFKPLIGKLALETGVDVLPLWLGNTTSVLPKGAVIPRGRKLTVHIGPPLCIEDLRRLTAGLRSAEAARRVSQLAQQAVEALRDGKVVDASTISLEDLDDKPPAPPSIDTVFAELQRRWDPARVEQPVTWYFSLGAEGGPRWTVSVSKERCEVRPGRPSGGAADCVVKTSEEMFTRMVKQAYIPEPGEFISGVIKTNEIPLLIELARVFNLSDPGGAG